MIVKKLYQKTKCRWWDEKRKVFESVITTEYLGWFLFGFIPIYLVELDKHEKVNFEGTGEGVLEYGIIKKYKHLMVKSK